MTRDLVWVKSQPELFNVRQEDITIKTGKVMNKCPDKDDSIRSFVDGLRKIGALVPGINVMKYEGYIVLFDMNDIWIGINTQKDLRRATGIWIKTRKHKC